MSVDRPTSSAVAELYAADGASASVSLNGAHILSWEPARTAGRLPDALFLSHLADLRPGASIRGGVPVIFPQFADFGPLKKHGFARTSKWRPFNSEHRDDGAAIGRFELRSCEATRAVWPHEFVAGIEVTVLANTLHVALSVTNYGETNLEFTGALHTYLATWDIRETVVRGLESFGYRDTAKGGVTCEATGEAVRFSGEVDRIYFDVTGPVRVETPLAMVDVSAEGFPDVVVWNPGAELAAGMADLTERTYRRFVCVEAAVVGTPVRLEAGESWSGSQTLRYEPIETANA